MISTGAPLQQLLREIRSRRHCVVCGGPGCGKTTLLKVATTELRREGIGVGYTFCGFTAKSLVRSAAQNLLQVHGTELGIRPPEQKEILAGTKLALRNFLIDQCGRRTIVLIVDPVGRLTKPYKCLIEVLMEHCTVVTSTETTDAYVGLFFWNFSKVKLENWTQSESFRAIDDLLPPLLHSIAARQEFKEKVFALTGGNPRRVADFCRLAQDRRYWIGNEVAVSRIAIDLGIAQIGQSRGKISGDLDGSR